MTVLLLAALMAWAGWEWAPVPSIPWVLAEMPATVFAIGLLLRDRPLAMASYFARIAAAEPAPRWRPPGARHELSGRGIVFYPSLQGEFLPPGVVSLDAWRDRPARPVRRKAA